MGRVFHAFAAAVWLVCSYFVHLFVHPVTFFFLFSLPLLLSPPIACLLTVVLSHAIPSYAHKMYIEHAMTQNVNAVVVYVGRKHKHILYSE